MNIKHFSLIILLIIPLLVIAQDKDPRVYQISGLVLSKTTNEPIQYARVRVNHTRHGAISNSEGFYSVPVGLGDTLHFTHIGYHDSKLVVADYVNSYQGDKEQYLYAINYMLEDTFYLKEVVIFPYDTPEELRTAVVNMDILQNSAEELARQNLDPEELHAIMATLPVDGGERLMVARQMYYDYYQSKNLVPTIGFDPIAATRLLQYIAQKAKKRKNKDLNYWNE